MPSISRKGEAMPASPIRKLVPFADQARKAGRKIYHLNIGQPDILTPENAMNAVRNMDLKVIEYSHSAGLESYRTKLTEYYAKFGIELTPDQIMITTGGSEALMFAFFSCLDPVDEIIIPEPFYANYNGFATAGSIAVRPVESNISDGFALPSIESFEALISERTKAILICNPANPTGYLYSGEELRELRNLAIKHDLFLFVDEVYREFCYDGREHESILTLDGLDEHVVVVDSISKRFSACGARIGALITRNPKVMGTAMKYAQARLSPPTLGQIVGEAALDTPQSYFDEVKAEYVRRRNFVVNSLNNMPGVRCPNPGGAFYAMAELPVDDADAFCQWLLESFDHDGATVMLAPGSGFYSDPRNGHNQVRIAYVLNQDELEGAMNCLAAALEAYPNRVEPETAANSDAFQRMR